MTALKLPTQLIVDEQQYEWIAMDNMFMGKFTGCLPPHTLVRRGCKYRLYDVYEYVEIADDGSTAAKHYKTLYYKVSDKFAKYEG